jgi:hypothetical protein
MPLGDRVGEGVGEDGGDWERVGDDVIDIVRVWRGVVEGVFVILDDSEEVWV